MQATSRTNDLCDACLMSKHNMVKGMQATSRTLKALSYGQRRASKKSHMYGKSLKTQMKVFKKNFNEECWKCEIFLKYFMVYGWLMAWLMI